MRLKVDAEQPLRPLRSVGRILSLGPLAVRRRWTSDGFLRHVTVLASGTLIAQILSFGATPALSRLYDPAAFGLLGLFAATAGVLGAVANLRYHISIVLPKSEEDALNLLGLALLSTCVLAFITLVGVVVIGRPFAYILRAPDLRPLLWWLPASVFAMGSYQAFSFWSTRHKHFGRLSISRISQSVAMNAVQVGTGLLGAGSGALVGGQVVGQAVGATTLGYQVWKDDSERIWSAASWPRIRDLAIEFRQFPFFSTPQALLNGLSQNLPAFLLAGFFSPSVVGLYVLAHKLLQVPVVLVGASVRQVFFQRASEQHNRGANTRRLHVRFTFGLAAIAVIPAAAVIVWGPGLFSFFLGAEWATSGYYAKWLIVWLFMLFINSPSVVLAEVLRQQKNLLLYDAMLFAARSSALVVGGIAGSAMLAIAAYSAVGAVFNAGLILWVWRLTSTGNGAE